MNWLQKLFNLDKIEELNAQIKAFGKLVDSLELERDKLIKENMELKKLVIVNTKEEETNNKYPKSDVTYSRQETDGSYEIDVRNYINEFDHSLPLVEGQDDDQKALNGLKWVIKNIKYVPDKNSYGYPEYWAYSYQTLKRKAGDCEDGSILLYNILLKSGVPYWKIRISAGSTSYGGHAYVTYYYELGDRWVVLDWCYFPNETLIKDRADYKDNKLYEGIWFSFNKKYSYALSGTKINFDNLKNGV